MNKKASYSKNLTAYYMSLGYEVDTVIDSTGKIYWLVNGDREELDKVLEDYKNDTWLHNYLNQFKQINQEVAKIKNYK